MALAGEREPGWEGGWRWTGGPRGSPAWKLRAWSHRPVGLGVEVEGPDERWVEGLVRSVTALCTVGASLGLETPRCHAIPG